jgi:tRNA (adenine57-N1/adenine58-N1)-methyltransferase
VVVYLSRKKVSEGDNVVLLGPDARKYHITVQNGSSKVKGVGVFNGSRIIGQEYGSRITIGSKDFFVLRPSIVDKIETLQRKAQIIGPKDASFMAMHCGIGPGSLVVEVGAGSGALTVALAHLVKPDGKIVSYEMREDHAKVVRRNLAATGLENFVDLRTADFSAGTDVTDADAVIMDVPEPWTLLEQAVGALVPGGHIATYSPTTNQVEKTIRALREMGLVEIRAFELIQREMVVGEKGIRPSFEMLGHTGYMTFARKVL